MFVAGCQSATTSNGRTTFAAKKKEKNFWTKQVSMKKIYEHLPDPWPLPPPLSRKNCYVGRIPRRDIQAFGFDGPSSKVLNEVDVDGLSNHSFDLKMRGVISRLYRLPLRKWVNSTVFSDVTTFVGLSLPRRYDTTNSGGSFAYDFHSHPRSTLSELRWTILRFLITTELLESESETSHQLISVSKTPS